MHYSTDPLISKNAVKAHSYHFLLKAFSALVPIDSVPQLTCALCRPPSWFLLSHCVRNNLPTSPPRLPANVFLVTRCWINWIMPFSFYSSKTVLVKVTSGYHVAKAKGQFVRILLHLSASIKYNRPFPLFTRFSNSHSLGCFPHLLSTGPAPTPLPTFPMLVSFPFGPGLPSLSTFFLGNFICPWLWIPVTCQWLTIV